MLHRRRIKRLAFVTIPTALPTVSVRGKLGNLEIVTDQSLQRVEAGRVRTACMLSGHETSLIADGVMPLTGREPNDALYDELLRAQPAGVESVARIGDCDAPGMIVNAVYSGYRAGNELDTTPAPAKREHPSVATPGKMRA